MDGDNEMLATLAELAVVDGAPEAAAAAAPPTTTQSTAQSTAQMLAQMREVVCEDATAWLARQAVPWPAGTSVVTSMPDVSETRMKLETWKTWFTATAATILNSVHPDQVAIFYQTDIKDDGVWVDKAFLVQKAAEQVGTQLLWHKMALFASPGSIRFGRPSYSHILCFSRRFRHHISWGSADVLPERGAVIWARGMGLHACEFMVDYCKARVHAGTIVDPFCGYGSILAIANEAGLRSIGVDLSRSRCKRAARLTAKGFRSVHKPARGERRHQTVETAPTALKNVHDDDIHDDDDAIHDDDDEGPGQGSEQSSA